MADPFEQRLQVVSRLSLMTWAALQLLFLLKTVVLPMGGRDPNFTMWVVHALPLLVFLPGLLRGNYRTYAWLSFALLLYFMLAVEGLFAAQASGYHSMTLLLVVVLFVGSVLFIRWKGLQLQWYRTNAESKGES